MREPDLEVIKLKEIGKRVFEEYKYDFDRFIAEYLNIHDIKMRAEFIQEKFTGWLNFNEWPLEEKLGVLILLPEKGYATEYLAELLGIIIPFLAYEAHIKAWRDYETIKNFHDRRYSESTK